MEACNHRRQLLGLLCSYPCPPPGSDAFAALVAYGAIARLRTGLPALAGGFVGVHHVNDDGRNRVLALDRVAIEDMPLRVQTGADGCLERWGAWVSVQ